VSAESHELQEWQSLELLRETQVGRLCIVESDYPVALPVNYVIDQQDGSPIAVVRAAPNSVLDHFEGHASLEIDDIDVGRSSAWSVIARGNLTRVLGAHSLPDPHPILSIDRRQWLVLTISAMSGRRFRIEPAADGCSVERQFV